MSLVNEIFNFESLSRKVPCNFSGAYYKALFTRIKHVIERDGVEKADEHVILREINLMMEEDVAMGMNYL